MSVERAVPAVESPIESIREIQKDRIAKQAVGTPTEKRPVCAVYLVGKNLQVDSNVPPESLLQVLGAAYMAVKEKTHPNTHIALPERKIIVP